MRAAMATAPRRAEFIFTALRRADDLPCDGLYAHETGTDTGAPVPAPFGTSPSPRTSTAVPAPAPSQCHRGVRRPTGQVACACAPCGVPVPRVECKRAAGDRTAYGYSAVPPRKFVLYYAESQDSSPPAIGRVMTQ